MKSVRFRRQRAVIFSAVSVAALISGHGAAHAQTEAPAEVVETVDVETAPPAEAAIIVTGSRIARSSDTTSPAPVAVIGGDALDEKGFTQVGQALNEITSLAPSRTFNRAPLANGQAVAGQQFPNIFNLGPARTLTLFNGRRMVSSTSGLGDEAVDTNIIPTGLLQRVDVVQGGGAAVYGSGAIAGVVNYITKKDFEGVELQAQYGFTGRGDYRTPSIRGTFGHNFLDGRANIAAEFSYSDSSPLQIYQRPDSTSSFGVAPNPAPGAGSNGIPGSVYIPGIPQPGGRSPFIDPSGLVVTSTTVSNINGVLRSNGLGFTFDNNGNVIPTDLGTPVPGLPVFTVGSDLDNAALRLGTLVSGVRREIGTLIGRFDVTDHIKISGELLFARTSSINPQANSSFGQYTASLTGSYPALRPIAFTNANPYLSTSAVAQLSAASPAFASGQPLYLSKVLNVGSDYLDQRFTTETLNGVVAVDGDFEALNRKFFWGVSFSHGEVTSKVKGYNIVAANLRNAADAVRNSAGQIVCRINATTTVDPACVPINIFGDAEITDPAALSYIYARSGASTAASIGNVKNTQDDLLATLSGDLFQLPGGQSRFSLSYEHRSQKAVFTPTAGDLAGIFFTPAQVAGSGKLHTNEFAGELEIPLFGGDFSLPLVEAIDLNASFRFVDNSLAGKDSVWSVGGRWTVGEGLTLRGTISRNFRAPSIGQVSAPPSISLGAARNPCSRTTIGQGPDPATRAANCLALFAANPDFGLATLPAGTANTPANRLAAFTATTISAVQITTQGNPALENEHADTMTAGFVFQPRFIPGLSISADIIRVKLDNALTLFTAQNYANSCFDAAPQPTEFCRTFTYNGVGDIVTGISSTVNAGKSVFHAETYNIDYRFGLDSIWDKLPGSLNLIVQATHNTLQTVTFAGTTTRTDDTIQLPDWVARFAAHYRNGPFRLNYSLNYLPSALLTSTSTVTNSPDGVFKVKSNARHDISMEYQVNDNYTLRAGVNNFTDELPSYPTSTYGDIVGRNYFVSANLKF